MAAPKTHVEILEPPRSPSFRFWPWLRNGRMQNLLGFQGHPAAAPPHPGVAGSPWTGGRRGGRGWAGRRGSQALGARGRSQRGATRDTEEVAPASPASTAEGPPGSGRRARGRGLRRRLREAGARRGLQVPACPAALTRPRRPLKGSGSRSRRVAAAFALPPLQGGREQPAPSPAPLASLLPQHPGALLVQPSRLGDSRPSPRPRAPRLSHPAAPMPRYG